MLEDVSLAIVPDWRSRSQFGLRVEDTQVYPADAIPKVFQLPTERLYWKAAEGQTPPL